MVVRLHLMRCVALFFFFNDTATTEIYTLSLHDALPISGLFVLPAIAFAKAGPAVILAYILAGILVIPTLFEIGRAHV